jgi:hypothetical protein
MVEFRFDSATGRHWLMEINMRALNSRAIEATWLRAWTPADALARS